MSEMADLSTLYNLKRATENGKRKTCTKVWEKKRYLIGVNGGWQFSQLISAKDINTGKIFCNTSPFYPF